MKFGQLPIREAIGGILAHSMKLKSGKRFRKGIVIDEVAIDEMISTGLEVLTVAMPEDGDVIEDTAASLIGKQFESDTFRIDPASTGRVNIFSRIDGVFTVSHQTIDAINSIDPDITIATLENYASVNAGRLIATIKIIPYAVSSDSLEAVLAIDAENAFSVHKYCIKRIGVISTKLPSLKSSVMDKTTANLEERLGLPQAAIVNELRVPHETDSIVEAIDSLKPHCEMLVIFGASAISDVADCIPAAIKSSGGQIIRFGMPVDPGNLMLLANIGKLPVLGAPGCARSIAENGFDWVLHRMLAGIPVTSIDIAGMGVGGLLMETGSRPHPREKKQTAPQKTAAIILAAGQSRRMGAINKMTVEVNGKPMVRHVAESAIGSKSDTVLLVTGHQADHVLQAVHKIEVLPVHNPDYERGLSASLATGINALPPHVTHAIILLGDMPFISSGMIDVLINTSNKSPDHIIVATHEGKRGNPVLWPRVFFEELKSIRGDTGARHIMSANLDRVLEVELGEASSLDLDTPDALNRL